MVCIWFINVSTQIDFCTGNFSHQTFSDILRLTGTSAMRGDTLLPYVVPKIVKPNIAVVEDLFRNAFLVKSCQCSITHPATLILCELQVGPTLQFLRCAAHQYQYRVTWKMWFNMHARHTRGIMWQRPPTSTLWTTSLRRLSRQTEERNEHMHRPRPW